MQEGYCLNQITKIIQKIKINAKYSGKINFIFIIPLCQSYVKNIVASSYCGMIIRVNMIITRANKKSV